MVKYDDIISGIFFDRYEAGATSVRFERNDLATKAHQLEIAIPKNLGDIIYTYKYRKRLPQEIINTAPESFYWRIKKLGQLSTNLFLRKVLNSLKLIQCWQL